MTKVPFIQLFVAFALLASSSFTSVSVFADAQEPVINPVITSLLSVQGVGGLALSPDGNRALYVLTVDVPATDQVTSDVWLVDTTSGKNTQLTHTAASEWAPQWHPDGQSVAFLSDRHDTDAGVAQVWTLPLGMGEARMVTHFDEGVEDYVISPDGKQLAVVVSGPDPFAAPPAGSAITTAPPLVIDRFAFKVDGEGYVTRARHLYTVALADGRTTRLASALTNLFSPAWSPDGKSLAFVARNGDEPDRQVDYDVFLIAAKPGATPKVIVSTPTSLCADHRPEWSADGKTIACIVEDYDRDGYFSQTDLALLDIGTGTVRNLTEAFDRNVYQPRFAADGSAVYLRVEDDMTMRLAKVAPAGGAVEDVYSGQFSVGSYGLDADGAVIAQINAMTHPTELYRVSAGVRTALTHHNDALLADRPWQDAQTIRFNSADGTEIHGLLMRPVGAKRGKRYPTVLWIHGGPTSQFAHETNLEPQLFAANGYAVVMVNPRGSTGRGMAYASAIRAAWGSVDVADVLAGVDHVVAMGVADPDRLLIGGWSYGAMLTNYVIASDQRFKAALSSAGIGNAWAGFGTDMHISEYLSELGAPWQNPEAYNRVSYPFMHADRITTPTLFQVGELDYNVPLLASEQMYQALRVLKVPTQLVIYPGQGHDLIPPSYRVDCYQRYLDWFERYGG